MSVRRTIECSKNVHRLRARQSRPARLHYRTYANLISERLGAHVTLLGLAGHVSMSSSEKLRGTADEGACSARLSRCSHVAARMEPVASRAEREGVPVVLIGHSIGAYIALEAVLQAVSSPSASPRILLLTPVPRGACER